MRRTTVVSVLIALCSLYAPHVLAAEEAARVIPGFVRAELLERPGPPRYPAIELRQGREGWVRIGYIVGTDGRPTDLVVEDSNGVPRLERAAMRWVRGLRYRPATLDGEPVPQAFNGYRIQFDIRGEGERVSRVVMSIYRMGRRALDEGDLDEVRAQLDRAAERTGLNLYEEAWLSILRGLFCEAVEDRECTLAAFDAALSLGRDTLDEDVLIAVANSKFVNELGSGRLRAARWTHEQAVELAGESASTARLAAALAEAEAQFASASEIRIAGTLTRRSVNADVDEGLWVFSPTRRMPALVAVEGTLDALEVRCDARQSRVEAPQIGRAWRIPESWGDCRLYFLGTPGTRLLVQEMHPTPTSAVP